jgi:hypothetical protein
MAVSDPDGYARLWLAELGAVVPEHHTDDPTPQGGRFGLERSPGERARRHSLAMQRERRAARAYRAAPRA